MSGGLAVHGHPCRVRLPLGCLPADLSPLRKAGGRFRRGTQLTDQTDQNFNSCKKHYCLLAITILYGVQSLYGLLQRGWRWPLDDLFQNLLKLNGRVSMYELP